MEPMPIGLSGKQLGSAYGVVSNGLKWKWKNISLRYLTF